MTKRLLGEQIQRRAAARRASALGRVELRTPSVPRESAEGVTSQAVKVRDPDVAAAVQAFLDRKAPQ